MGGIWDGMGICEIAVVVAVHLSDGTSPVTMCGKEVMIRLRIELSTWPHYLYMVSIF